jgi:hypothetical protein
MRTFLIIVLIANILVTCYSYYITEVKRDYRVIEQVNDSTRLVEYKKLYHYRTGLERRVDGDYIETVYCYSENFQSIAERLDFLYIKELYY